MSAVQGKVINHGEAPYQHDSNNQNSYFVELDGESGKRTLWGVGIRDAMQLENIKNGDEVIFYDKGLAEGTKKRNWKVEHYEKSQTLPNSIEPAVERETEKQQSQNKDKITLPSEEDLDLPSNIQNNYIAKVKNRFLRDEKIHFYDREDIDSIAFEDRQKSLNTSREDEKTIKAMLDVAHSKGWTAISIKGTEAFKRETWLEANIRGIETKGYKPTEKDLVLLEQRKLERSQNIVVNDAPRSKEINAANAAKEQEKTKEQDLAVSTDENITVKDNSPNEPSTVNQEDLTAMYATDFEGKQRSKEEVEKLVTEHQDMLLDKEAYNKQLSEALKDDNAKQVHEQLNTFTQNDKENTWINAAVTERYEKSLIEMHNNDQDYSYADYQNRAKQDLEDVVKYLPNDDKNSLLENYEAYSQEQTTSRTIEQEAFVRSEEFNSGRDIDPNSETSQEIEHKVNARHYVENIEHGSPTMLGTSEKFLKGVHIRDNKTGENYELVAFEVEYMGNKGYGLVAEHYIDDEHYAKHEPNPYYDAQDFSVLNKIGLGWDFDSACDDFKEVDKIDADYLSQKLIEQEAFITKEEDKTAKDHAKDAALAVGTDAALSVATGGEYTAASMATSIVTDKVQSLALDKAIEQKEVIEERALTNENKIAVEAYRSVLHERYKNEPDVLKSRLADLDSKLPDIATGKIQLEAPTTKHTPNIEVATQERGSQDRQR